MLLYDDASCRDNLASLTAAEHLRVLMSLLYLDRRVLRDLRADIDELISMMTQHSQDKVLVTDTLFFNSSNM